MVLVKVAQAPWNVRGIGRGAMPIKPVRLEMRRVRCIHQARDVEHMSVEVIGRWPPLTMPRQ
jgi:hypothetical protein